MSTIRLIRHSIRAVGRYKLRSGFIMLGSFVGVAALTLVIIVGEGVERRVLRTVNQLFGGSSMIVMAGGTHLMGGPRADAARMTIDDITAVAKDVPEIESWDPQQAMSNASIRHADTTITSRVLGASERWDRVWERSVSRGENFDAAAVATSARVALIGETVARKLFGDDDPIDADVQIGNVQFKVIGILERFGTDLHGMDRDNEIVVPISTIMRRLMNVDTISAAKLLVRDPARSEETSRAITRALRARHALAESQPDDFHIITAVEVQKMVTFIERILFLYLPIVAGVAMIVAGIVAASVMLVSVNQRVGEIGLRRAVGARAEDVRLQFLVETAITMLGGGVAGILFGVAAALFAKMHLRITEIELLSWKAAVLGIVVSIVTGLIAGVAPARRAARLAPTDALRS
jgi:putative ABC transport system permease protein